MVGIQFASTQSSKNCGQRGRKYEDFWNIFTSSCISMCVVWYWSMPECYLNFTSTYRTCTIWQQQLICMLKCLQVLRISPKLTELIIRVEDLLLILSHLDVGAAKKSVRRMKWPNSWHDSVAKNNVKFGRRLTNYIATSGGRSRSWSDSSFLENQLVLKYVDLGR